MKKMNCSCKHEYQDQKLGKGVRYHNPMGAKKKGHYRCTVCGAERQQ